MRDWQELDYLRNSWNEFFDENRINGNISEDIIFNPRPFTPLQERRAKEKGIDLQNVNILYPLVNKIVNTIIGKKPAVSISDSYFSTFVKTVLETSVRELNKIIKDLTVRGYAVGIASEKIEHVPHYYYPFFDRTAHSENFDDGNFCGYTSVINKVDFINKYGSTSQVNFDDMFTKELSTTYLRHIWIRESEDIVYYVYSECGKGVIKREVTELKRLPMVFMAHSMVIRREEEQTGNYFMRILPIGLLSKSSQELYNSLTTLLFDFYKNYQYQFLAEKDSIAEQDYSLFENKQSVILPYICSNSEAPKQSEPTVVPPLQSPREAIELINETKQSVTSTWLSEAEVTTSSKYDSFSVLSEKQRQAQMGVNEIIRSYEGGLHHLILSSLDRSGEYVDDLVMSSVIRIGDDEMREKNQLIELLKFSLQYTSGVSPAVNILTFIEMLKVFNDSETGFLQQMLQTELEQLQQAQSIDNNLEVEKLKYQSELNKAQANVEVAKINAAADLEKERYKLRSSFNRGGK